MTFCQHLALLATPIFKYSLQRLQWHHTLLVLLSLLLISLFPLQFLLFYLFLKCRYFSEFHSRINFSYVSHFLYDSLFLDSHLHGDDSQIYNSSLFIILSISSDAYIQLSPDPYTDTSNLTFKLELISPTKINLFHGPSSTSADRFPLPYHPYTIPPQSVDSNSKILQDISTLLHFHGHHPCLGHHYLSSAIIYFLVIVFKIINIISRVYEAQHDNTPAYPFIHYPEPENLLTQSCCASPIFSLLNLQASVPLLWLNLISLFRSWLRVPFFKKLSLTPHIWITCHIIIIIQESILDRP